MCLCVCVCVSVCVTVVCYVLCVFVCMVESIYVSLHKCLRKVYKTSACTFAFRLLPHGLALLLAFNVQILISYNLWRKPLNQLRLIINSLFMQYI